MPWSEYGGPEVERIARRGRCAPLWVRAWTDKELHAVASRFVREQEQKDLTQGQEWLLSMIFSELAHRRRRCRPGYLKCSCQFCFAPFD